MSTRPHSVGPELYGSARGPPVGLARPAVIPVDRRPAQRCDRVRSVPPTSVSNTHAPNYLVTRVERVTRRSDENPRGSALVQEWTARPGPSGCAQAAAGLRRTAQRTAPPRPGCDRPRTLLVPHRADPGPPSPLAPGARPHFLPAVQHPRRAEFSTELCPSWSTTLLRLGAQPRESRPRRHGVRKPRSRAARAAVERARRRARALISTTEIEPCYVLADPGRPGAREFLQPALQRVEVLTAGRPLCTLAPLPRRMRDRRRAPGHRGAGPVRASFRPLPSGPGLGACAARIPASVLAIVRRLRCQQLRGEITIEARPRTTGTIAPDATSAQRASRNRLRSTER